MRQQPSWLAEAWRELGQSEISGPRHNPRITALFKELGHEKHARDEVAWCAAFVGACLERAGLRSTRSLMARSYADFGTAAPEERLGALAVLSRGPNPALGHVGFLVGWSPEKIWLLGGNQGDRVSVAGYDRRRLIALRWPQIRAEKPAETDDKAAEPLFRRALEHVLEMEGGFTDDPHDPGGPTNKGITLRTLAAWRGATIGPDNRARLIEDLKAIQASEVEAIYRARYWRPAHCEAMPDALALFHFDASVNHGVNGAARMLQKTVDAGVDGVIGPETKGKIAAMPILKLLALYAATRRSRYRALPHFWRFGRGWLRRVDRTLAIAREIADAQRTGLKTRSTTNDQQNGDAEMPAKHDQSQPKWWGESMTIWGAIITAAAAVLPTLGPVFGLDITGDMVREVGDQGLAAVQAVTALIGTLITIYGRARAIQPLVRRDVTLKL